MNASRAVRAPVQPAVLTVDELAERWSVDRKTIYAAIDAGQIAVLRLGRDGRVIRIALSVVVSLEQGSAAPGRSNAGTT